MQAVLVLAHNNYDWVARLSKKLSAVFEVFIHFDMRLQLTPEQMEELNTGNIHCYQKIKVMWGGLDDRRGHAIFDERGTAKSGYRICSCDFRAGLADDTG